MSATNLNGTRGKEAGRVSGPAAGGRPPAPLGPIVCGGPPLASTEEGERAVNNCCEMRGEGCSSGSSDLLEENAMGAADLTPRPLPFREAERKQRRG
jgi:hypothetical protein